MNFSPLINSLISTLRCLPGVGPKSAQRMAFYLLERNREGGKHLAKALLESMEKVKNCQQCRMLCETDLCNICNDHTRDDTLLCVVETPADVLALEYTAEYRGKYFVLMGHLSPIDSIGPEEIGVKLFNEILTQRSIKEIIMATNPTVEGEATAYYLAELAKTFNVKTTRIAHGVSLGGEIESFDEGTLARALGSRSEMAC